MNHENDIRRRHEDRFIDRYFPDATPEEREVHRADLRGFASVMLKIASRVETDRRVATSSRSIG